MESGGVNIDGAGSVWGGYGGVLRQCVRRKEIDTSELYTPGKLPVDIYIDASCRG